MAKKNAAPTKSQVVSAVAGCDRSQQEAGRCRARIAHRPDEEGAQGRWRLHAAGRLQDARRSQARHEGARRRESFHRREDDDQGQAGLEEGADPRPQEPERDGRLIRRSRFRVLGIDGAAMAAPFVFQGVFRGPRAEPGRQHRAHFGQPAVEEMAGAGDDADVRRGRHGAGPAAERSRDPRRRRRRPGCTSHGQRGTASRVKSKRCTGGATVTSRPAFRSAASRNATKLPNENPNDHWRVAPSSFRHQSEMDRPRPRSRRRRCHRRRRLRRRHGN